MTFSTRDRTKAIAYSRNVKQEERKKLFWVKIEGLKARRSVRAKDKQDALGLAIRNISAYVERIE